MVIALPGQTNAVPFAINSHFVRNIEDLVDIVSSWTEQNEIELQRCRRIWKGC